MDTHQMACMFNTFIKDKNSDIFGVSYASCGPTISGGGWKGSGQDVMLFTLHYGSVPSCHAALFY
jgi:hypothetical protein